MSTSKTYAVAIVCGGHPHVFAEPAPNEVAATISALRELYAHLSDNDNRYDFYEKCEPFCDWLEAQNFTTLEALQNAIYDANEDAPESIQIGLYTEEVVSCLWHLYQIDRWKTRALRLLNSAKGYKESYLHSCDKWAVLREQYNEMQDYYDAMQREGREQLAKARILQIGFLAAGIGLGLVIHHLIF